ncbi:hypothetical protein NLX67_02520 [Domibacillus sp. A3M-37]|uniref:hypothetical protein n=1 Tax=Domibacillus TaxID=1433999 RepID=UPI0020B8097E|nr:hypothetical protein [Domibacillus sp. A3M-37]MCP3761264.1 hypothetical protein [Domibacillus sp. A3M-37]
MKQSRQFLVMFFSILFLTLVPLAAFNYAIDPLWTFSSKNEWNDHQDVINERQQKTNQMYFQPFSYDTILLGSSRSTYIDQHQFENMNVYNYSVSNMSIREYDTFLAFAEKQSTEPVQNVILGLDFFKSSVKESSKPYSLANYETKFEDPLYRFKNLLSLDTLDYSIQNARMSSQDDVSLERVYNRENVADAKGISKKERDQNTSQKIERFKKEFYGDSYVYNPRYKEFLTIFNERHPNVNKIVYTTPISMELFDALVETGHLSDYEQWLRDLVDLYGGIYNFMYPNDVTNDLSNYFDGHHFYPETGDKIAERINAGPDAESSFGVYVTKENIERHLQEVRSAVLKRQ